MAKRTILIIDDDVTVQTLITGMIMSAGYDTVSAGSAEEGLALAKQQHFCLALLDIVIPEMGGEAALSELNTSVPALPVIILTGNHDTDLAIRCIRNGARDFLTKPCEKNRLLTTIQNVVRLRELEEEVSRGATQDESFGVMFGRSTVMRRLFEQLRTAATTDIGVLLEGASGTGKELAARALHSTGMRAKGPFVALNCGAIPESLLESELFGHEKGAFTGAANLHRGAFEQAQGGTLFLDEIGEMRPDMQVRLLRALENREVRRVGGTSPLQLDVRIVAATNKKLQDAVRDGKFRDDLFYRLAVFRVTMPALAERDDDILWLAHRFMLEFSGKFRKRCNRIDKKAELALLHYSWPGNVRQLRNAIERATLVCGGEALMLSDLPDELQTSTDVSSRVRESSSSGRLSEAAAVGPETQASVIPSSVPGAILTMAQEEERIFRNALRVTAGDVARAAQMLDIGRATLYRRIKELEIDTEKP